jgi:hypothetical protein
MGATLRFRLMNLENFLAEILTAAQGAFRRSSFVEPFPLPKIPEALIDG